MKDKFQPAIRQTPTQQSFIVLTILAILCLTGCDGAKEAKLTNITEDYFYGAWADTSQNGGFIFDPSGDFYLTFDGNITSGDYNDSLRAGYELHLEAKPIVLELIMRRISDDSILRQETVCTLEPLDSISMRVRMLNDPDSTVSVLVRSREEEQ